MNNDKEFVIVDRLNSVAFQCFPLVRFRFNNIDYLVYYFYESVNVCKVFTSRIIYNGNNKYSLCNISNDEKIKIRDIISAIIVDFPSSYSKNLDINKFVNDFTVGINIFFSKDIPNLEEQSLYSNSFFANSSSDYINYTKSFYNYIMSNVDFSNKGSLIWSIPLSEQGVSINRFDDQTEPNPSNIIHDKYNQMDNLNVIIPISGCDNLSSTEILSINNNFNNNIYTSDDFGFNYVPVNQESSSIDNKKNAGFASNGYIIIGTICLILSSIVVATAIIIIKNF